MAHGARDLVPLRTARSIGRLPGKVQAACRSQPYIVPLLAA